MRSEQNESEKSGRRAKGTDAPQPTAPTDPTQLATTLPGLLNPGSEVSPLTEPEMAQLNEIVRDRLGILLPARKRALVLGRLERHVQELGLHSFTEYCEHLKADRSGRAMNDLANRIVTPHTSFYREPAHFEFLSQEVLPPLTARLAREGSRDLRVWCAGCASGEEAYTLTMVLLEHLGTDRAGWQAGLLATDLSSRTLETAATGLYPEERIRSLPSTWQTRYFTRHHGEFVQASEKLKAEITFRRFNLMNATFPFRRPFHVIFCRNVMIYFDEPTRQALAARFVSVLAPGGHLFIGHSETLGRDVAGLRYLRPAVYVREGT